MKSIVATFLLISFFLANITQNETAIMGVWSRHGDKYRGIKVEVKFEDGKLLGTIIYVPEDIDQRFGVGEIKWEAISKNESGHYQLGNLRKPGITPSGTYILQNFVIDNDTLRISNTMLDGRIGHQQVWVKDAPM